MIASAMAIIQSIRRRQYLTDPLNRSDELAIARLTAFINDYESHRVIARALIESRRIILEHVENTSNATTTTRRLK